MIGDSKHLANLLEAMKMVQATLQQLMNLSAGGLALFFSFIAKTPSISSTEFIGAAVVVSWVISLSAAAYAHKLHAYLFLSLARITSVIKQLEALESLPDEVDSELQNNPNKPAVIERAKTKLTTEREWGKGEFKDFEKTFFPAQEKARYLVQVSLFMLVLGFIMLSVGYFASRYTI